MAKGILLVDDSIAVRDAVRTYLNSEPLLEVCGEASDGVEAIEKAEMLSPDLIIMDYSMPRMNGLVAAEKIKQKMPHITIILFTLHKSAVRPADAIAAGISTVIGKSSEDKNLLKAQIFALLKLT